MDAMVMPAISRSFPHLSAALVVIAVHVAIALWLLQPRQYRPTDNGVRTSLRWLLPRPVPPRPPATAARQPARSSQFPPSRVRQSPSQPSPSSIEQATASPSQPRLDLSIPDTAPGGAAPNADTFAHQPFRRLNNDPAFRHAPRYFRLKPQMSPRQMIQGVARNLGFWPPGYEIDPCSLSRNEVNHLQNAVSEGDRATLRSALLQESARCRR